MTRKKLLNIYKYSTLAILTLISSPLWTLMSFHFVINESYFFFLYLGLLYFGSMRLGDFLYVLFSGVMVNSVQFIGDPIGTNQEFDLKFQLGFSPVSTVHGRFDNKVGVTENELADLFYDTITRQTILLTFRHGLQQTFILRNYLYLISVQIG